MTNKIKHTQKSCSDQVVCHEESYGRDGKARECVQECTIKTTISLVYSDKMDINKVLLHTYDKYDQRTKICINERSIETLATNRDINSSDTITLELLPKVATPCAWIEVKGGE